MADIILNSLILYQSKDGCGDMKCAICTKAKEGEEIICSSCFSKHGCVGIGALVYVFDASENAMAANRFTDGGQNRRKTITPTPVYARVKIKADATLQRPDKKGIESYYKFGIDFSMEEKKEQIPVFAFGFDKSDIGQTVSTMIDIKVRTVLSECQAHYIRLQKVKGDAQSNVRLHVTSAGEIASGLFVPGLPREDVFNFLRYGKRPDKDKFLRFYIGFVKV